MKKAALFTYLLLSAVPSHAQQVVEERGNIFLVNLDGSRRQITSSGHDYDPYLAADKAALLFGRRTAGLLDNPDTLESELWMAEAADGWRPRMILRGAVEVGSRPFTAFYSPQLSPDHRFAYFEVAFAATSNGVVRLDISARKTEFVIAAIRYWVVPGGPYKGHLVVQIRKAKMVAGYYEWFYLISPDGKEVGVIGPDESDVQEFLSNAADR